MGQWDLVVAVARCIAVVGCIAVECMDVVENAAVAVGIVVAAEIVAENCCGLDGDSDHTGNSAFHETAHVSDMVPCGKVFAVF